MKICLIGQNLTNLILASLFTKKKLKVDLYLENNFLNHKTNRTIAISADNFKFLNDLKIQPVSFWRSKEIKIYVENLKSQEIINFKTKKKETFNLISYFKFKKSLINKIKKSKYVNIININASHSNLINKTKSYDLVINSENDNIISKKFFYNKIKKDYKSYAYTFVIDHNKIENYIASQIFTKFGPLAFLPISRKQTSIVFSYLGKNVSDEKILELFKNYNSLYNINRISNIEKFPINFLMLRNYIHKNILAFGDLIHRIHPLAGQGFNMTIRDIKSLSNIIDQKLYLGLPVDISVAEEFQKSNKHLNYLYGKAIDGIYEFFKFDSQFNSLISKSLFKVLNKNLKFKKYSSILSDRGLNL